MAINFNKPVQTRDGRKVRILCTDGPNPHEPVVGVIDGQTDIHTWAPDGRFLGGYRADKTDLVNAPERVERWLVVDCAETDLLQYRKEELQKSWAKFPKIRITYEDGKPVSVALEDI